LVSSFISIQIDELNGLQRQQILEQTGAVEITQSAL
jgi:hypothetical protein